MHALIQDGVVKQYPYGIEQLRRDNPSTSFPNAPSDALLESFGVQRVFFSAPPAKTDLQVLEELPPVFSAEDQRWTQVWAVRDLTFEEEAIRDGGQASGVRYERNNLLARSDWTQGKDVPDSISGPWAVYRQALRDIPIQAGFPWAIEWPIQPE